MTNPSLQTLVDLLFQKATSGLSPHDEDLLVRLQRENDVSPTELETELEKLELSAAVADLACFQEDGARMPDRLKDQVLVDAGKYFESQSDVDSDGATTLSQSGLNGWMISTLVALAACILLLLNSSFLGDSPAPSVADRHEDFISSAPADLIRVPLEPGFDKSGQGLSGNLVWSDKQQHGFMRFKGLKINDPQVEQYQLWIFDRADQKLPVDGGVFDVDGDDVLLEIDAKIHVEGKYWAVTVERPGGVVQSDRSRIAAIDGELLRIVTAAAE